MLTDPLHLTECDAPDGAPPPRGDASQRRGFAQVETAAVGDSAVLRSRVTGATVIATPDAERIFAALRSGASRSDAATNLGARIGITRSEALTLVDAQVDSWTTAGLFDLSVRPFAGAGPYRRPAHSRVLHFASRHGAITVRIEDPVLAAQIESILAHSLRPAPAGETGGLDILRHADRYTVYRDGCALWRGGTRDEARFVALQELIAVLCGEARVAAVFHAALVTDGHRGLLLAGPSGRGKTTLSLDLARAGLTYVADDLVPLMDDGLRTCTLPMAANVKPRQGEGARHYDLPPRRAVDLETLPIAAIAFPCFAAGAAPASSELAPEEALVRLLKSGTEVARGPGTIAPLARLLNNVPSYDIRYGDSRTGVETCLAATGMKPCI